MAYVVRTKDNPGDVGRAADQQQSVDNESALYAAVLGAGPVATGGMVRQFVKLTGLADDVNTNVFFVATTNEAGDNDAGVYGCYFEGIVAHGIGPTGDTAVKAIQFHFARAMRAPGAGQSAPVLEISETAAAESEGGTTKGIGAVTVTCAEATEYSIGVAFQVDLDGTTVTTASVYGMVTLIYAGFTTPPVITSVG